MPWHPGVVGSERSNINGDWPPCRTDYSFSFLMGMIGLLARIWNAVLGLLIAVAAVLAIAFMGVRLVGLTPYAVLSGSMEPELPVGSLVYVREVDPSDVAVGDVITFKLDSGTLVTHEVYEIDADAHEFRTHGIANVDSQGNISPDATPVSWSSLVGRVVTCVPLLGYVNVFITQPPGIFIAVSGVAVVAAVSIAIELMEMRGQDKRAGRAHVPGHMR